MRDDAALLDLVDAAPEYEPEAPRGPVSIFELELPQKDDPNTLLGNRFLCRGGIGLVVGPTGIGKSSFTMQAAMCWALGWPAFGINPARPLRTLIVQAENDDGDMAEMVWGVARGLDLAEDAALAVAQNVFTYHEVGTAGAAFGTRLDQLAGMVNELDLIIIDPAFAFLGGDALAAKDVSFFVRCVLMPLAVKHNAGLMIVHHTNKPPTGKEKQGWAAGDFAYLGAGSAEWANSARCVLAIRSLGSDSIFELIAPKRGKRLGWKDENQTPTVKQYIAHHREPGVICWRTPDADEVAAVVNPPKDKPGRKPKTTSATVVELLRGAGAMLSYGELVDRVVTATGCGVSTAKQSVSVARKDGLIDANAGGFFEIKTNSS